MSFRPRGGYSEREAPRYQPPTPLKTILLVDDDPEIVDAMRMVLETRGYRTLVARDGNGELVSQQSRMADMGGNWLVQVPTGQLLPPPPAETRISPFARSSVAEGCAMRSTTKPV